MAKRRISSSKWQPVIFNGGRLASTRAEQEWMRDLLSEGKIVACPSEIGMVVWMRAGRDLAAKKNLLRDVVEHNSWMIGLSDRSKCWRFWREEQRSERLERMLKIFWPGPLQVRGLANSEAGEQFCEAFGRKIPLWMPYSNLGMTLLKICDFPLVAARIKRRNDIFPLDNKAIIELYGNHFELIIEGRERPGTLEYSALDVVSRQWRLVHRGQIGAEHLLQVCGTPIILSGEASDAIVGSNTSAVRLIVFEGEPERVARRMRSFIEGIENPETLHYYIFSEAVKKSFNGADNLHVLANSSDLSGGQLCDAVSWQKLALQVWEQICALDKQQEGAIVLLEGVPRNECTEEFMERMTRLAHQVINVASLDD